MSFVADNGGLAGITGHRADGHRRFEHEVLNHDELDSMILMPTVVACGLCLTAIFLLGYETLA